MAEKKQQEQADEGRKAIFKIPNTAMLAIAFLTVCVTPIAFGEIQGLEFLYLAPILLAVFVIRTRTVASSQGLAIRTMFGHRDLPWSALKGVAITKKAKVRAVLTDDSQLALPAVRTRHLPVLSLVSEGRLPDPSGVLYQEKKASEDTERSETSPQE